MKSNVGKPATELQLVLERMDPYQRLYICTHEWMPRTRSKGVRPRHKVNAKVVRRSPGEWAIEMKQGFYGHSHLVLEEIYRSYPSVRRIPGEDPFMKDVELMVASGSRASRIYDYIRERSMHYVQLKNVYNTISKIKSCDLLVNFELEASDNVAAVD
ncbi:Hypothetical protein PHPALM_37333 [Phytophthora palmivora]|uniref:Uncharacterized protein n=1 Tax=Phytophthora palmivora TaxID=4796 RepID=A0A2P4WXP5_9STRA|nr:Hypothetical protein PHPALM_37333 [Phytophthora palmivora]